MLPISGSLQRLQFLKQQSPHLHQSFSHNAKIIFELPSIFLRVKDPFNNGSSMRWRIRVVPSNDVGHLALDRRDMLGILQYEKQVANPLVVQSEILCEALANSKFQAELIRKVANDPSVF